MSSRNCVAVFFTVVVMVVQLRGGYGGPDSEDIINQSIEKISCVLEDLLRQAGSQNNKLDEVCSSLDSLNYGFTSLGKDVKELSSLSSKKLDLATKEGECIEDFKEDTNSTLESISDTLDECKTTLESIEILVHPCKGLGWAPVVEKDFTNEAVACPDGWEADTLSTVSMTVRGCGRVDDTPMSIDMATFTDIPGPYNQVCGRILAVVDGGPEAFIAGQTLDDVYVDGVSLTHGSGVDRTHIWTFAAAGLESTSIPTSSFNCPCYGGRNPAPSEVGTNFFCEGGVDSDSTSIPPGPFLDDPLWDGEGCTLNSCCDERGPPYFFSRLDSSTTDPIDARLMHETGAEQDKILITNINLFVRLETDPED